MSCLWRAGIALGALAVSCGVIAVAFFVLLLQPADAMPDAAACGIAGTGTPQRAFFVDSSSPAASDSHPGTSPEAPLASLAGLGKLLLQPGDRIAFKAGSRYRGELVVSASGSEERPIVFTSYGSGPPPVIRPAGADGIRIQGGTRLLLENLQLEDAADTAIVLDAQSSFVTVQRVVVRRAGRGIQVSGTSHRIVANDIGDLHMVTNTPGGDDDSGAQGFVISGRAHVFLCNRVRAARASSYDYGVDGVGFEFWRSVRDVVLRWNRVEESAGFLEIGGLPGDTVENVVIEGNLAVDAAPFSWIHNRPGVGNFGVTVANLRLRGNTILERLSRGPLMGFSEAPDPHSYRFECNLVIAPLAVAMFSASGPFHAANDYVSFAWPDGDDERGTIPLLAPWRVRELRQRLAPWRGVPAQPPCTTRNP